MLINTGGPKSHVQQKKSNFFLKQSTQESSSDVHLFFSGNEVKKIDNQTPSIASLERASWWALGHDEPKGQLIIQEDVHLSRPLSDPPLVFLSLSLLVRGGVPGAASREEF